MTHHIWARVFVASLILLGDGVFAAEIDHRDGTDAYTGENTFQLFQPALLNDSGTKWQPLIPNVNQAGTAYNLAALTIAAVTDPVLVIHKYQPLNSRAPPIPAV